MTKLNINFALIMFFATHVLVANADIYGYTDAGGAIYLTDTPTQTTSPVKIDKATSLGTTAQTDELPERLERSLGDVQDHLPGIADA